MSGEKRRGVGCSAFALLWERRCGDPTCSRRRPASRPTSHRYTQSPVRACSRWRPDRRRYITDERTQQTGRSVGRLALLLRCTPPREAERRFCAVGSVGASLLAKNLRAPRGARLPASSLTSIASKLAPTGRAAFRFSKVPRCKSGTISGRDRSNGYVHPQKSMSPVTQLSRASPLPQGSSVATSPE